MLDDDLHELVGRNAEHCIALRREFHQHPEQGWLELWTTDRIVAELEHIGVEVVYGAVLHDPGRRMGVPLSAAMEAAEARALEAGASPERVASARGGFTGAMAIIRGGLPGPIRALRCDIDALPIPESEDLAHRPRREGFASSWQGSMHACGHDAHMAIALGVAETIAMRRAKLRGMVKIFFQPAEEGVRGAASMVAAGLADDVEELYGFHVGVGARTTGEIVCGWDGLLATCKLDARLRGRRAHAAIARHEGRDALAAACWAVMELERRSATVPGALVNVGRLFGGEARNVVAAEASLEMDVRAGNDRDLDAARALVETVLTEAAGRFGVTFDISVVGAAPAANPHEVAIAKVERAASLMHDVEIRRRAQGYSASDDAALWMNRVLALNGIASFVGIGSPIGEGHHTPGFDLDERAIPVGVELFARIFLGEEEHCR